MELTKEERAVIDCLREGAHVEVMFTGNKFTKEKAHEIVSQFGEVLEKESEPNEYASDSHYWLRNENKIHGIECVAFYKKGEEK